ncbi:hypothetical protein M409DRAFT_24753 [Zasmidium cellare ATCC 36951]|uniref:SET domain-containing protein n=1 Tax=Zasmidium cellare ATCC 36951 TaxID=1080233 RepID=A0A6A6CFB1_ZASCE|nr:uncharacterized protein M409DRAFT_24753 [Zasmidium cellare ATCC 36951]KAF2164848.1 hypothetical protein M409DRAFT_24753 [Zasmidium cellare ATCC 36951]
MAKQAQFRAYDLNRKKQHKIPSPPTKLSEPKLREGEWKVSKRPGVRGSKKPVKKGRTKKSAAAAVEKAPKRAADLLRCKGGEFQCLHCSAFSDEASCGTGCYKQFRREHLSQDLIDIRGPGPLGYGAFTKPGVTIPKGAWVGEYLGELRPLSPAPNSTYRFEIPSVCAVDAQSSGNWTRFINSHCRPNVKPWGETVGKRHVILFQALREIGPEEEIVFNYGARYFENAGFLCGCDAQKKAHLPQGAKQAKGRKK